MNTQVTNYDSVLAQLSLVDFQSNVKIENLQLAISSAPEGVTFAPLITKTKKLKQ